MNLQKLLIATAITTTLLAPNVFAGKDHGDKKHHENGMHAGYKMHHEMTMMLKTTMEILRDLNHQPSAAEKEKLTEMIGKIDNMLEQHTKMKKKHKEMGGDGHHGDDHH